jgi:hypothetical protein
VSLIPAQHRYGDIAILNEAAAVQAAIEPVAHATRLFHPFRIRPVALSFAQ